MRWLISLIFPLLCSTLTLASDSTPIDRTTQRQLYQHAEQAFKKNDHSHYNALKSQLQAYPLYPYLIYEELKQSGSLADLEQFEKTVPDFPFHAKLRHIWLAKTAKAKQWDEFIKGYQVTDNEALQCQYHFAQYQTTQDPRHLKQAKGLWLVGYSQDPACDPLFQAWRKKGNPTLELVKKRILLALDNKQYDLAKHLSKDLAKNDRHWVEEWEKYIKNPTLLQNTQTLNKITAPEKIKTEMISRVIREFARREPEKAAPWWKQHQHDLPFTISQKNQILRDIGVTLAQQKSALAQEWLASSPKEALDTTAQEWQIRIHIAKNDWPIVAKYIEALPTSLQEDPAWQYWLARAEQQNDPEEAQATYQKLAQTRGYYGFLASMRLHQPLSLQHETLEVNPQHYATVLSLPAMARFEELRLVGKETLARLEWFCALEKMNMEQRHAAAKIAQKMGLHDLAIFTMAKSTFRNDLTLRFPLAHEPEIINYAKKHHLDPAWVFALTRQESAFYSDAYSSAGARGLMQLLPSTAKMVADRHQIPYSSGTDLHHPLINIQLGTAYLKDLKQKMFDHIILATAAYNAGPTRIPRWLYRDTMEADCWIENIPYKETREYVKNVLTYTSIYQERLGASPQFLGLLQPIPAATPAA